MRSLATLTILATLLTVSTPSSAGAARLEVERLLESPRLGYAPTLAPWPDGLPPALGVDSGRLWHDGIETPVGPGQYYPQTLGVQVMLRLAALEAYPAWCQASITAASVAVHTSLADRIVQQDAYIRSTRSRRFTALDVALVGLGSLAIGVGAGAVLVSLR